MTVTDRSSGDSGGEAGRLPGGLTETETSALLAVCVVVGIIVLSRPAPLETRLPTLAVALFVTAVAFVTGVRQLR